jgi:hypothetical protein
MKDVHNESGDRPDACTVNARDAIPKDKTEGDL